MTARVQMVSAWAKDLLERLTGKPPRVDHDGDLCFELGGAQYYLRVMGEREPVVRVFSVAMETDLTPQLLELLNELNTHLVFARTFWVQGQVLVEADHGGMTLDPEDLVQMCDSVARATDAVSPMLRKRFEDAPLRFEEAKAPDYEPPGGAVPGYI